VCEPDRAHCALYLACLSAALGAPKESNHLWHRVFNTRACAVARAPFFPGGADCDCYYQSDITAGALVGEISNEAARSSIIHRRWVAAVAWACYALALSLPSRRGSPEALDEARVCCRLSSPLRDEQGMDADLVRAAEADGDHLG
jgi:hypothetical protein